MLTILIILGLMALLIGLLGTVYPAIPGLGLMFAGAWLLAYAGDIIHGGAHGGHHAETHQRAGSDNLLIAGIGKQH